MRKTLLGGAFVLASVVLGACGGGYYGGGYYATTAPPAPRYYGAVGVAPGPGYIWTDGYWDWRGGNWGWRDGRWQRPPRRHARWVAPEWRREGRGYRFHQGRWR
jgi:hypothetical protein